MIKRIPGFVLIGFLIFGLSIEAQPWSAAKRLTWNAGDSTSAYICIDNADNIHVFWMDNPSSQDEIYYKSSTDSGTTWAPTKRITWNPRSARDPVVASNGGSFLHLIWSELEGQSIFELYYKRSTNNGASWGVTKKMTWGGGYNTQPSLVVYTNHDLHMVWNKVYGTNFEIVYRKSTDGGITWSGLQRFTWNTGQSENPKIALDSSLNPHIVWDDNTSGNKEIFYKHSTDGGTTWAAIKRLTWNSGLSYVPVIAIDSSDVIHVAWSDSSSGDPEVYYRKSTDGGATWSAVKRLTWSTGTSTLPDMVIDSGDGIHLVWHDSVFGNFELLYKNSSDGGVTWTGPQRLTWNSGFSLFPSIDANSANKPHIVWNDDTSGNNEIYYKKKN